MLRENHLLAQTFGSTHTHYGEVKFGAFTSLLHSLITKWSYQNANLLQVWSELGVKLARSQYFRNGNKRTALLVMTNFINSCGFSLKGDDKKEIFLQKWEKLLIDIATSTSEELALELTKERILLDICLK